MCILFLAINQHPKYPIIICANRDEFYARPTRDARFWPERPYLLAGRDLQAGGSWLGINTQGQFAAITNIRLANKHHSNDQSGDKEQSSPKRSRGELVTLALEPNSPIDINWLKQHSDEYSPFNLTYGSLNQLVCYNSLLKQQTTLTSGFHAISNGALDDVWPKMAKGERDLEQVVSSSHSIDSDELFSILKDRTQAEDSELPDTGIPIEWERKLSSIFINSPEYGTRSSCLLLLNKSGTISFTELGYDADGNKSDQRDFELNLPR
jgi:uncharacterized protein with NRDE domain